MARFEIRAVVFDFDDTLALHPIVERDKDEKFWERMYRGEWEEVYSQLVAPDATLNFITRLQTSGIDIMALTWSTFSFAVKCKEKWLQAHYGDAFKDRVYSCGTREAKLKFLKLLCNVYNCAPCEIAIVEDNDVTNKECREAGFVTINTLNVLACGGKVFFEDGELGVSVTFEHQEKSVKTWHF